MSIFEVDISDELKDSYLRYALSVIISRAIPDVRDGLKPVQRRIIYAMYTTGNHYNKPYKKSARIVGEVLGKYHPHGDAPIYDALVRMAQSFSLRYPLVDGHGNFGSIDGDPPAAMRYTEVRMAKIAHELVKDIDKDTVDFVENFDNTLKEPTVLPTVIPNLLVNGSSGIAVGMASNIPPHNLSEVVDAIVAYIEGKGEEEILNIIKGPDFPTGGQILGREAVKEAYKRGIGKIRIRGKAQIKEDKIIIKEIPYQVSKSLLIEKIVEHVKSGDIRDVVDLKDLSDKKGIHIEIKVKKGSSPEVVLNQISEYTPFETTFNIINIALVNGRPEVLPLYRLIEEFVKFRKEVTIRKIKFLLRKAEEELHIILGLLKALEDIDKTVEIIRRSSNVEEGVKNLMEAFGIDEVQAKEILNMRLQKLISTEREKLLHREEELTSSIARYKHILSDEKEVLSIIKEELLRLKEEYGDQRRTEIIDEFEEEKVLIQDKPVVIILTDKGYIKRMDLDEFKTYRKGSMGLNLGLREGDSVMEVLYCNNKSSLLLFTNLGRVYEVEAHLIPLSSRTSKGEHVRSLLPLKESERIVKLLEKKESKGVMFFTKNGLVKRTPMSEFSGIRSSGIIAINLRKGDELRDVILLPEERDVLVFSEDGKAVRFNSSEVRPMGRAASGVRAMDTHSLISSTLDDHEYILILTKKGRGKLTPVGEFPTKHRGGKGVISILLKEGDRVVFAKSVKKDWELILTTKLGKVLRLKVSEISVQHRHASGVRVVKLKGDEVISASIVPIED